MRRTRKDRGAAMSDHTRLQFRKLTLLQRGRLYDKRAPEFGKTTCGARTRKGTPCRCLPLANGRCKLHGGLSTGPKTADGWARVRAAHAAYWAARKSMR
jgi:hypothetical protein